MKTSASARSSFFEWLAMMCKPCLMKDYRAVPDQSIYDHCCREQRCLVTLDLDFADVTRFSPSPTVGIAVIRVPKNPTLPLLESLIRQFLHELNTISVNKQLWIIEVGRIRVHQSEADEETGL